MAIDGAHIHRAQVVVGPCGCNALGRLEVALEEGLRVGDRHQHRRHLRTRGLVRVHFVPHHEGARVVDARADAEAALQQIERSQRQGARGLIEARHAFGQVVGGHLGIGNHHHARGGGRRHVQSGAERLGAGRATHGFLRRCERSHGQNEHGEEGASVKTDRRRGHGVFLIRRNARLARMSKNPALGPTVRHQWPRPPCPNPFLVARSPPRWPPALARCFEAAAFAPPGSRRACAWVPCWVQVDWVARCPHGMTGTSLAR